MQSMKAQSEMAYVTGKTKTLASPFGMIKSWWNLKQDITLKKINGKWIITEAIASAYQGGIMYILLYNFEKLTKEELLKSYKKDGFTIAYEKDNNVLLKNVKEDIVDEETYIKIVFSYIKKINTKNNNGKVIDLSKAFEYAKKKGKYKIIGNKFDWYVRNEITKNLY